MVTGYLSRVIRNPKFLLRENFLLHPLTSFFTVKQIMENNCTLLEFAQKLTSDNVENLQSYIDEISQNYELQNHIDKQYAEFHEYLRKSSIKNAKYSEENPAGRLNRKSQGHAGHLLYVIIRSLKPEIVVETGVSGGESSSYILQGLEYNRKGKLYSIDLPPDFDQQKRNILFPPGKANGWVIPEKLKNRWTLNLGPSKDLLRPLMKKLKQIDIFWHDSLHTYENMLFEFDTTWDFLHKGGVILCDDVVTMNKEGRSPLTDFAKLHNEKMVIHNMIGGLRKS